MEWKRNDKLATLKGLGKCRLGKQDQTWEIHLKLSFSLYVGRHQIQPGISKDPSEPLRDEVYGMHMGCWFKV